MDIKIFVALIIGWLLKDLYKIIKNILSLKIKDIKHNYSDEEVRYFIKNENNIKLTNGQKLSIKNYKEKHKLKSISKKDLGL